METASLLRVERILMFAFPVIAVVIGLARVIPAYGRLQYAESQLTEQRKLLHENQERLNALLAYPHKSPERAVAPATADEPIDFLVYLARLARESNIDLISFNESAPPATPAVSGSGGAASTTSEGGSTSAEASKGVREAVVNLNVEGTYASILRYISRLERGERIVAVSNLQITPKSYPRLGASFSVTRFVFEAVAPVS
ncbi:MAG: hypothetical protein NZT92_01670 [Abditibacteriales bacterium]|nr:hypothetical protein [Abditibacteriales bacterium]MDW8364977.1 hypothetical protein [Abditibacteriales bacterium]